MRAELQRDGTLDIIPDNPCEAFALDCWWKAYQAHLRRLAREPSTFEAPPNASIHIVDHDET